MALVHQVDLFKSPVTGRKDARYRHRFIVWDSDWNVIKVTDEFDLMGAEVEFVCGAAWHHGNLLVTFGVQDNAAMLMTVPGPVVDEILNVRPKVIDYFMYNGEKELLELRINALKDKVDKFVISEADRTHRGDYKGFSCSSTITELGLPGDNIEVLEVELPEVVTEEMISDWDRQRSVTSGHSSDPERISAWVREHIQRDAIHAVIDKYANDDIFFMSDCDEIVNPDNINFIVDFVKNCDRAIIKIPLVMLEGRADLRVYDKSGTPEPWDQVVFSCKGSHLKQVLNSRLRFGDTAPLNCVWLTQEGEVMQDLGWHFSWMGNAETRIRKAESFFHYADTNENFIFDTFGTEKMYDFMSSYKPVEGGINPCGQRNTVLKRYDTALLPKQVFSLPRVRDFLLPAEDNLKPIPVVGTAIVNGIDWLIRLVGSIDYPVDNFFVVNNNGRGQLTEQLDALAKFNHPFIKNFHVCHMPNNIGCPASWNLIIKSYLHSPYWLIVNHDVAFTPGLLQLMAAEAEDQSIGMVHASPGDRGTGMYDLFILKDWVVDLHGLFDENFYPAYGEDLDYIIRTQDVKKTLNIGIPYLHGDVDYATTGSQTWRTEPELRQPLDTSRVMNETEYMVDKWGADWYNTPQGPSPNPGNFSLQFTRKKSLWR